LLRASHLPIDLLFHDPFRHRSCRAEISRKSSGFVAVRRRTVAKVTGSSPSHSNHDSSTSISSVRRGSSCRISSWVAAGSPLPSQPRASLIQFQSSVYQEVQGSRDVALKRELEIKALSHREKEPFLGAVG
jgi:hypothetical protein